jgi:hypothetical protein
MAVELDKSSKEPIHGQDIEKLRMFVQKRMLDDYCNKSDYEELFRFAISDCQINNRKAVIVIESELEALKITNEKKLLIELEEVLQQFTQSDKKLDEKEKADAIQMVCKPRVGFAQGLKYDTAEVFILQFCRKNSVKVKVGFLRWAIP